MQESLLIPNSPVIIMYANNYNDSNAVVVTVLMATLNESRFAKREVCFNSINKLKITSYHIYSVVL